MKQKHKYKVGTKVLLGPKIWQEKRANNGAIFPDAVCVITEWLVDEAYGISREQDHIRTTCDESQILSFAFKYGQEIEVSVDGTLWERRYFSSYSPHSQGCEVTAFAENKDVFPWHHARPLPVKDEVPDIHPALQTLMDDIAAAVDKHEEAMREEYAI